MTKDSNPPRVAEGLLRSLLRPSDRESISGDLLEEYCEVRRPAVGALRANAWYVNHALSFLWRLVWPCVVPMMVLSLLPLSGIMLRPWNPSLVQAPGVSLMHALICVWAGYSGSRRTRLIRTGVLSAVTINLLGFAVVFAAAAMRDLGLVLIPFSKSFIFVILLTVLSIALGFAVVLGAIGGIVGKWFAPRPEEARAS